MENYKAGPIIEVDSSLPFDSDMVANVYVMRIKPGSKITNIVNFAYSKTQDPSVRRIVFSGVGNACTRAVSCVEVFKRRSKNSWHQITKLMFKRIEEYWDPIDSSLDLERLKVNRDVPAIYMLLSKDPLNSSEPGYQPPGEFCLVQLPVSDYAPSFTSSSRSNHPSTHGTARSNKWRQKPKSKMGSSVQKDSRTASHIETAASMHTEDS